MDLRVTLAVSKYPSSRSQKMKNNLLKCAISQNTCQINNFLFFFKKFLRRPGISKRKVIDVAIKNCPTQNPEKSYFNLIFSDSEKLMKPLKEFKKGKKKSFSVTVSELVCNCPEPL